ncbi:MAG TPA: site-specific integrase [Terriglobales bacterium]|nr:site-specific integrase [Terriglobales bacterium]
MTNLTTTEMAALLKAASHNERDTAFILIAYNHGARRGELLNLRGTDVANGCIRIVRLKQKRTPIICVQPLQDSERNLVVKLAEQVGDGRLFDFSARYASAMVKRYLERAGIYTFARTKSLHSLRHSCGTNLYQRGGKDIFAVASWLGHKSISSSQRYVHMTTDELNAMAANAL